MKAGVVGRCLAIALTVLMMLGGTAFAIVLPLQLVSPAGSSQYTSSATVTLSVADPEAVQMQLLTNNSTWSTWTPAVTKSITLPAGDGVKTVFARFKDADGNLSSIYSNRIILDTKAPAGSVAIEYGAAATDTLAVTLSLAAADANGVSQMRFSNDGVSWTEWEPFAFTKSHDLSGAAGVYGTRKVWAQFMDPAGKISASATDTILYVASLPAFIDDGTVTISTSAGGTKLTATAGVKLTIDNPDPWGYSQMSLSKDGITWGGWVAIPAAPVAYTLASGDGIKTVFARFRAGTSGTPSAIYGSTIVLDTKPPVGAMVMNGGDYSTDRGTVTLSLEAADLNGVAFMQFSENGTTWDPPVSYMTTADHAFSGDGVKKLYVRFIDEAGKVSPSINESIILDTAPPAGTVKINGGATTTMNPSVTLTLAATGAAAMNLSLDGGDTWVGEEPFATSRKITLPEGGGDKTVMVKFVDITGNESAPVTATIALNTLQGTYQIVGRESSFWQSIWQDGLTHVTDNIWGDRPVATFDGKGGCSVRVTSTGYDKQFNGVTESVRVQTESFTSTTCSYTGPDADGLFVITVNGTEEVRGRVAYDGNSVVMGGAPVKTESDGSSYDMDEMIGVRAAASGVTPASLSGTYNLVSHEQSFLAGGGHVSDSLHGNNVTATFNGNGTCSVTENGTGFYPDGMGGITAENDSGTSPCTYTITSTGAFTISLGGADKVTGWASADGNTVIMGGAGQESDTNGTGYTTHLVAGVKAGNGMDLSSVSGTYHLAGTDLAFWSDGRTVSKNYWRTEVDITFDGAGACSLTNSGTGYHVEYDMSGNQYVVTDTDPLQAVTDCSYVIDPSGSFTLTLNGTETHSGWASADGNSVVMGGASQEQEPGMDGTNYDVSLMFGVKVKPYAPGP